MLKLLPLFFLAGCVSTHSPKPSDTIFKDEDRDWLQVYAHEIKVAKQNNDLPAWLFFLPRIPKELKSRTK